MHYFGAKVTLPNNGVNVEPGNYLPKSITIEADWSAASYWYGIAAIANEADITLLGLKQDSMQGDAAVVDIYKNFGVATEFIDGGIRLTKFTNFQLTTLNFEQDFTNCPDIAQTVAVTCAALNVKAKLTGLKTLRIKETDRIVALQTELNKLGFNVEVEGDDLLVQPSLQTKSNEVKQSHTNSKITSRFCFRKTLAMTNPIIKTYNDHRMAMAFAPLALLNEISIENPEVVKKSYPEFWEDLKGVGFTHN